MPRKSHFGRCQFFKSHCTFAVVSPHHQNFGKNMKKYFFHPVWHLVGRRSSENIKFKFLISSKSLKLSLRVVFKPHFCFVATNLHFRTVEHCYVPSVKLNSQTMVYELPKAYFEIKFFLITKIINILSLIKHKMFKNYFLYNHEANGI